MSEIGGRGVAVAFQSEGCGSSTSRGRSSIERFEVGSCSVVDRGDQRERTALPEAGFIDFIREIYKGYRASNLGL